MPLPDIRDKWWVMKDEGERERGKDRGGRSKREIKRTSVEKDCLFDEGWLRSDKVKRALFAKGVIPEERENWKGRQNMWKERDTEGGKDRKRANAERAAALKNIWEPSGSGEKNAGLSWNSRLPSLHCYSPASHPTNTFPQKTQSRGGRVQSIRESPWALQLYTPFRLQGVL